MATSSSLTPLLRRAAPRLSKYLFPPRQCLHHPPPLSSTAQARPQTTARPIYKSLRKTPFLQAFRSQSTAATASSSQSALSETVWRGKTRLNTLLDPVKGSFGTKGSTRSGWSIASLPTTSEAIVAYWLLGSAASVYGMVVLGGLTRLTESGLSITEWRPVTGTLPPLSTYAWREEYDKYRASPEFQKLNPNMSLEEFKKIFYMEYAHRLWGRVIGLTAIIPTVYFIATKKVSAPLARNLLLINGLIGFQGFVGWWMVKSGLKDDLFANDAHPRVSQYRLTVHLGLAFGVYTAMLWNGLQIFRERKLLLNTQPAQAVKLLDRLRGAGLKPFRTASIITTGLIAATAMSGALVAGLDAGLIYNEFPYMGNGLTPPKSELWSTFYSRKSEAPHTDLIWRNMLENPSLVQLDHRIMATTTFLAINALFAFSRLSPVVKQTLTKGGHRAMAGTLGAVYVQVVLGLSTLLYLVPLPLASAHQAGSLAVLTGAVVLGSRCWTSPRLLRLVQQRLKDLRTLQSRVKQQRPKLENTVPKKPDMGLW